MSSKLHVLLPQRNVGMEHVRGGAYWVTVEGSWTMWQPSPLALSWMVWLHRLCCYCRVHLIPKQPSQMVTHGKLQTVIQNQHLSFLDPTGWDPSLLKKQTSNGTCPFWKVEPSWLLWSLENLRGGDGVENRMGKILSQRASLLLDWERSGAVAQSY